MMKNRWLIAAGISLILGGFARPEPVLRGQGTQATSEFIILGTASGPNSEAARSQPANALVVGGQLFLVDAGDGAVAQLARAGLRLPAVRVDEARCPIRPPTETSPRSSRRYMVPGRGVCHDRWSATGLVACRGSGRRCDRYPGPTPSRRPCGTEILSEALNRSP
jgi:hypothetical protein